MIRGTFANIRLRNRMAGGVEGGFTRDLSDPDQPIVPIFDAAEAYAAAGTPLVILAGSEYGSGSSRDWAAKGTALLGVRAVIAESYERIHRSNLTGFETYDITGIEELNLGRTPRVVRVTARRDDGGGVDFEARVRIDTPGEADYYRNGGILPFVLRSFL
jgi:aconitate hydratase